MASCKAAQAARQAGLIEESICDQEPTIIDRGCYDGVETLSKVPTHAANGPSAKSSKAGAKGHHPQNGKRPQPLGLRAFRVYTRVDPAQKIRVVETPQARGEFVAMVTRRSRKAGKWTLCLAAVKWPLSDSAVTQEARMGISGTQVPPEPSERWRAVSESRQALRRVVAIRLPSTVPSAVRNRATRTWQTTSAPPMPSRKPSAAPWC